MPTVRRAPVLIIDAEKEELMDIPKNGGRAAELIKGVGTPVGYHVISDITHYRVFKETIPRGAGI